jgi:hypothetical protein
MLVRTFKETHNHMLLENNIPSRVEWIYCLDLPEFLVHELAVLLQQRRHESLALVPLQRSFVFRSCADPVDGKKKLTSNHRHKHYNISIQHQSYFMLLHVYPATINC